LALLKINLTKYHSHTHYYGWRWKMITEYSIHTRKHSLVAAAELFSWAIRNFSYKVPKGIYIDMEEDFRTHTGSTLFYCCATVDNSTLFYCCPTVDNSTLFYKLYCC
ncbi:unnamed protein product, partial [Urochloa humidicola]